MVNIKKVLESTEDFFAKQNISEPRLDAEVLLADLLQMERIKLYVNYDYPLSKNELDCYRERILKRAKHYPVAYITGHKEFMSLDFIVNENVLIPRPETEQLVEKIISICQERELKEPNIVDVGTGSGAIMVSLGHYLPGARILGIDISDKALAVARENIKKHELSERLKVIRGDLLHPLLQMNKDNVDIVVSNPPYISQEEMKEIPPDVRKEPETALAGGEKGLKFYKRLLPEVEEILSTGGLLALEIGCKQADAVRGLLQADNWKDIRVEKDYAGHDRMVFAVRK